MSGSVIYTFSNNAFTVCFGWNSRNIYFPAHPGYRPQVGDVVEVDQKPDLDIRNEVLYAGSCRATRGTETASFRYVAPPQKS